jgi:hypothetical protein
VAAERRLQPLIGDEFDVGRPAPAQRRDEHCQPITAAADGREVGLHLTAWFGLEANQRLRFGYRPQRRKMMLQDPDATPYRDPSPSEKLSLEILGS